MDPLSITAACMALTATITKTSISVTNFVRSVRAARSDLDAISRELASLKTLLELIAEDAEDINTFPETLRKHIAGILANCELVLIEVQRLVEKYAEPGVIKGSKWALAGSEDVAKLRMSLEAHKSALEIALEMVTLFMTREIKTNTSNLRHDTAAIKQDTTNILQEIARLRAQLPDDLATLRPSTQGPDSMLIHYLDDLTSYAETVCWSGEDSDTDTEGADDSNTHHSLRNKQKLSHKRTPSPTDTETVTMGARNPLQGLQAPSHVAQNTHLPIHTVRTASPRLGADETIHAEDQESKVILKPHHVREERPKVLQQSTSWVPGHVTSRSDDFSASNISGAKLDGVSKGERASLMLAKELAAQEQEQAKMRARRARQATERQQRVVSHASPPRNTLISSQGTWTLGKTSALESQGKLKFATNEMTREIVCIFGSADWIYNNEISGCSQDVCSR
ncbi:uncharacterized protein K460DRAFT_146662 [Cucurbitaria berberidis CBS 394.84]|uniref:Azaphilone pigments biosynthesis cluster protein L N-terminal domain-containing protein n=1 Tax=Cucurbitaria berberidis CBS 394.84 TaxID=1168544 RepID=A0A9P4GDJ4_9PLEO|nr:uncharacterized protein K460DRAFT_146662 [Cucurbitaria berberidis CBS 394.84]KAF1843524.1 hypothetical protein K460DRAFT_146662 [Cucurbitaria berberidis CBS 394.84]